MVTSIVDKNELVFELELFVGYLYDREDDGFRLEPLVPELETVLDAEDSKNHKVA